MQLVPRARIPRRCASNEADQACLRHCAGRKKLFTRAIVNVDTSIRCAKTWAGKVGARPACQWEGKSHEGQTSCIRVGRRRDAHAGRRLGPIGTSQFGDRIDGNGTALGCRAARVIGRSEHHRHRHPSRRRASRTCRSASPPSARRSSPSSASSAMRALPRTRRASSSTGRPRISTISPPAASTPTATAPDCRARSRSISTSCRSPRTATRRSSIPTSTTSSASSSCAVRREPCSGRARSPAPCGSSPAARISTSSRAPRWSISA